MPFSKHLKSIQIWLYPKFRVGVFTQSSPRGLKKKITIIENFEFDEYSENLTKKPPYFPKIWISDLEKCYKYGGYRKFLNKYYWSHRKLQFFDSKKNIYGGIPKIIKNTQICNVSKIDYLPHEIEHNNVSKYTFKIKKSKSNKFDVKKAMSFNYGGANSFQHFIQDCLPVIVASKDFLIQNPDIAILLPKPIESFSSRSRILKWIGINNLVIDTNFEKVCIDEFYFWNFKPFAAKYTLPKVWYKKLYDEINYSELNPITDKLVLITRNERMRSFLNTEEIISELKLISNDLNLDLLVIESSSVDISKYRDTLSCASVIISMHGGANYNLVFADKNCLFFEFVPIQNTGSTIDFISGLGIRYIPVPLNFSFAENNIHVNNKVIKEIGLIAKELLLTIS